MAITSQAEKEARARKFESQTESQRKFLQNRAYQTAQIARQAIERGAIRTGKVIKKIITKRISRPIETPRGYTAAQKLASAIVRAYRPKAAGVRRAGRVGRPRGIYRNPAGVPAKQWYKIIRARRRAAQIAAEERVARYQQALMKRGLSPEITQRLTEQAQMRQLQQVQAEMPQEITSRMPQIQAQTPQESNIWQRQVQIPVQPQENGRFNSIWRGRQVAPAIVEEVDILGNRVLRPISRPESFWN